MIIIHLYLLTERFGITLTFPDAYQTVKDTANFTWIEKKVVKGHLNIIAYTLPLDIDLGKIEERIPKIRDSIGELFVPGRVPGSYMITERAYLPYYYKTKVNSMDAILTKGTWEVQNDFMAGPYVNYIIKDTIEIVLMQNIIKTTGLLGMFQDTSITLTISRY